MATYNGEKYIKKQLESILCQLEANDELIVSDDASTDNTLRIIESFQDPRIKVFVNTRDKSKLDRVQMVTTNFENALSKATGDYIFMSDQDDCWHPDKIKIMLGYLADTDYVQSACVETDENLEPLGDKGSTYHINRNKYTSLIIDTPYMGSCTAVTRRLLNKCLPFPSGIQSHDRWIGFVAAFGFTHLFIPDVLMYYRRHDGNVSSGMNKSKNSLGYRIKTRLRYMTALFLRLAFGV